ncbi:uncharacterized protein LOC114574522 [Exaiptasia diaphana]|uniref:Uncharacterized protein n=1 Tax=Exaiptasia diaphana TaxID=2652724 RepID=A0A913YDQ4_EXADI|nr:uncharacterized protein LOC114574522 [Exaiptasia diaphana]
MNNFGQKTSNKTTTPLPSMGKKISKSGHHQVPPKTVQESESASPEDEVIPCSQSFYKKEQFSSDEESVRSGDPVIHNSEGQIGKNDVTVPFGKIMKSEVFT